MVWPRSGLARHILSPGAAVCVTLWQRYWQFQCTLALPTGCTYYQETGYLDASRCFCGFSATVRWLSGAGLRVGTGSVHRVGYPSWYSVWLARRSALRSNCAETLSKHVHNDASAHRYFGAQVVPLRCRNNTQIVGNYVVRMWSASVVGDAVGKYFVRMWSSGHGWQLCQMDWMYLKYSAFSQLIGHWDVPAG